MLDTNVLSELRKPRPDPSVERWFGTTQETSLFVSVLTFGEVRRGIERLRQRDPTQASVFETWLGELETAFSARVLDVDVTVAQAWGRIGAEGPIPAVDGLLAATALVHGLVVVSRDTRPYERIGVAWLDPWSA